MEKEGGYAGMVRAYLALPLRVLSPRPAMKALLVSLALLCCAVPARAQEVILDFEKGYPEDQFYFLTYNAESDVTLTSVQNGHVGRATKAAWDIEAGAGGLGYAGFGYLHGIAAPPNLFPDLSDFTHLSLWYNNVGPAAGAENVAFRFELHEAEPETDPDGQSGLQVWIYETNAVLTTPTGWTQLLMPLREVDVLGNDGFAITPGGFIGDGVLDLDQIKHWAVILLVQGEPVGASFGGETLFDYLTAEALPIAVAPEPDASFEDALYPGYPNPFTTASTLTYSLRRSAEVSLRVYDLLGREVALLVEPQEQAAGRYEVALDAPRLAAGTYVCVLDVGGARFTQRVTRVR